MDYTEIKLDMIRKWLKGNMDDERFVHSLGTANCAKELAHRYGLDERNAYIAGLLHDCAKCFPPENLLNIINNSNLELEEGEKENYKTLHAPASAIVAKNEFDIDEDEILSAIRWHTIGSLDMTEFEKVIFLADKIEPNTRDKSTSDSLRKLLDEENGLDKALLECYKYTILSLVNRNLKICTQTINIYNELQKNLSK